MKTPVIIRDPARWPYPVVMTEDTTLDWVLSGGSIARVGDQELSIALGPFLDNKGGGKTQHFTDAMSIEMRRLLGGAKNVGNMLICIPNIFAERQSVNTSPKQDDWLKWAGRQYTQFYDFRCVYGSSFITRTDSAPWIDRSEYWYRMRSIWAGKDVTLVWGGPESSSLHPDNLKAARSVRSIIGPVRDAYNWIDELEREIGNDTRVIMICLGAAATCLAVRLAKKGIHAVDLGHLGRFMPKRFKAKEFKAKGLDE